MNVAKRVACGTFQQHIEIADLVLELCRLPQHDDVLLRWVSISAVLSDSKDCSWALSTQADTYAILS